MTQKQPKQKKCRITEKQLNQRFSAADTDKNGTLSADQITILLQSLGYDDTYKGTIKKICRNISKKKKLDEQKIQATQQPTAQQTEKQGQKQALNEKINSEVAKDETDEERRQRKEAQKKREEDQAQITFKQFMGYFEILQKPIGKILYKANLQRAVDLATFRKKINLQNLCHKNKGQKIKINLVVGEQKLTYNSSVQVQVCKQPKSKKNDNQFWFQLSIKTQSPMSAASMIKHLKGLYDMILQIVIAENEDLTQINEIINVEEVVDGDVAKLRISTNDQDLTEFIKDYLHSIDQLLETELGCFIRVLYRFNFNLAELNSNKNSVIQEAFTKDCNIQIQYTGSRVLDAVKEIALKQDVFQLLKVDNKDPYMLSLLGFLSLQKGDLFMKFKNVDRTDAPRELTQDLLNILSGVQQMKTEQFNLRKVSQLIDGPIMINARLENVKLNVNIDVKDILKLPFYFGGQDSSDSD